MAKVDALIFNVLFDLAKGNSEPESRTINGRRFNADFPLILRCLPKYFCIFDKAVLVN